ncbi:MAG TPA: helix-turn-helix domain-containing protein [Candidatus Desulfaltia sp.]|nr:helix-turn-helix domain-containing protein [Candidatus Desulfaltia sp.]
MQVGQLQLEKGEKKKTELMEDELDLLAVYTKETSRTRIPSEAMEHISALKSIDQALSRFKLSKNEVRVYLYLARFGAHKAQSVAEALGVHRTEAYKILRRLETQGLISRVMERPMKFVAVPFETVLNNLIEERRQRIYKMEQQKTELLKIWKSLPEPENVQQTKETFQVLEGKRHISVRLNELLTGCNETFDMVASDNNLIWLYNTPFLEELDKLATKKGIKVRLLTNYSPTSSYVLDQIEMGDGDFAYLKKYEMPGYFVKDGQEMILLMANDQSNLYGMWTNYGTIVDSYKILFELLWKSK